MILSVITLFLFLSASSATLLKLNRDSIREIVSFGIDIQLTLSQTCKNYYDISRDQNERFWQRKNMPYFAELPYHPDWEMIADFPTPTDLHGKARHLLMVSQWLHRVPAKFLMHKRAEEIVVREIYSLEQPLFQVIFEVASREKVSQVAFAYLFRLLLANNELTSALAIHRICQQATDKRIYVSAKTLERPAIIEALKDNPESAIALLFGFLDILKFWLFKIKCTSAQLQGLLPRLHMMYGERSLFVLEIFFRCMNHHIFITNLDSLKEVYDYFTSRGYPDYESDTFKRKLMTCMRHPHGEYNECRVVLLRAFKAQDRGLFLKSLDAFRSQLFPVADFLMLRLNG